MYEKLERTDKQWQWIGERQGHFKLLGSFVLHNVLPTVANADSISQDSVSPDPS